MLGPCFSPSYVHPIWHLFHPTLNLHTLVYWVDPTETLQWPYDPCIGPTLALLWPYFGPTLTQLWPNIGPTLTLHCLFFVPSLTLIWLYLNPNLPYLSYGNLDRFGPALTPFWPIFKPTLALRWSYFDPTLVLLWPCFDPPPSVSFSTRPCMNLAVPLVSQMATKFGNNRGGWGGGFWVKDFPLAV